jgi:RNA polymerase sigma-70 factor (ECF subfamily)
LESVLAVVYLVFNAGYTAGPEAEDRDQTRDLCAEAIYLARLITDMHPAMAPDLAEAEGCLALMLLTHARSPARRAGGVTVPLAAQDRRLWDAAAQSEGLAVLSKAMARAKPGPYQIKAAISACHLGAIPDWPQIAALYGALETYEPTPVVRLNHAVALAETGALATGLEMLLNLGPALQDYQPYHAALAEYLTRAESFGAARSAFDRAIALSPSSPDAAYLAKRQASLPL